MQINAFLAKTTLAESLSCNAGECMSWIIVLFNILTVFYLAFCAWFKVTKSVKLFGWIWTAINVCSTIFVLFLHTCIFTILCAVFTGLITMATLSVVFNKNENSESSQNNENKILGYYVIFQTIDKKFVFRLYDSSKKFFMTSRYKYNSIEEVKIEIENCRNSGVSAMIEDRTKNWIKAIVAPKFVMILKDKKYSIEYMIVQDNSVLKSESYIESEVCLKCAQKFKKAILSEELYFSKEILADSGFVVNVEKNSLKTAETQTNKTADSAEFIEMQKPVSVQPIIVEDPAKYVEQETVQSPIPQQAETNYQTEVSTPQENKNVEINKNVVVAEEKDKDANNLFPFVYTGSIKNNRK